MIRRLFAIVVVAVAVLTSGSCSDDNNTVTGPNPTATPPGQATMTPTPPGAAPTPTPPAGAVRTVQVGAGGGNAFVDQQSLNSTSTINVGDTIEWVWVSGFHSTTSGTCTATCAGDGKWDSGVGTGMTFRHTFTQTGAFPYFCLSHGAMMQGMVNVQ
jgi:plastocyanin